MNKTEHGEVRMRQRGKRELDVRVLEKYGERQRGDGIRFLTRRSARPAIARFRRWLRRWENSPRFRRRVARVRLIVASLERVVNWMLVSTSGKDGERLITVYRAGRARQRRFLRGACRPVKGGDGRA